MYSYLVTMEIIMWSLSPSSSFSSRHSSSCLLLLLGDKEWKKYFYRLVDSLETENGEKLRNIEEFMFKNLVKDEVEKASGPWEGNESQNYLADRKIAAGVKSTLKNYEKKADAEDYDGSYFTF